MTATITERVAAGAALLDEKRPGWWRRIDLNTLVLSSPCNCILGQEFDEFWLGLDGLELDRDRAAELGFDAAGPCDTRSEYASLESAWTDLIEERRAAAERAS